MTDIRKQAKVMGHAVVGPLKRVKDDVFRKDGQEVRLKQYVDSEGTLYAVNRFGSIAYISGEDFVI